MKRYRISDHDDEGAGVLYLWVEQDGRPIVELEYVETHATTKKVDVVGDEIRALAQRLGRFLKELEAKEHDV